MTSVAFSEVVVPLDLSGDPDPVLAVAAGVAERACVGVRLVMVCSPGLDHGADRDDLERLAARLGVAASVDLAESNDVVPALLAASEPDGLICIETRARRPAAAAFVGSTTRDLLAVAARPVLVVGPSADPTVPMGLLEVGVGDPSSAGPLVAAAGEWARFLRLRLRLVHVLERGHWDDAAGDIAALAGQAGKDHGVEAEGEVVAGKEAPAALVADARSHQASVVAVGVHRASWLRSVTLGSVARHVAHEAAAAVLAVPTPVP